MMGKKLRVGMIVMALTSGGVISVPSCFAETLTVYCFATFQKTGKCPENICEINCINEDEQEGKPCKDICLGKECSDIPVGNCPKEYCAVLKSCSGTSVCHAQTEGEKPSCGDLAYFEQDRPCCDGLIRRCGVEFLDGSCDMQGEGDPLYNVPICIPCGDGVCSQFEDSCNCPEDCSGPGKTYTGLSFQEPEFQPQAESNAVRKTQVSVRQLPSLPSQENVVEENGISIQTIESPAGRLTIKKPVTPTPQEGMENAGPHRQALPEQGFESSEPPNP